MRAFVAGQTIFFVEGEGKCDRLRAALRESGSRGAVATIAGGANAPIPEDDISALVGAKKLYFLADSDIPGCGAATERARAIATAYPGCDVRIIDLYPERNDGSDVADWLLEGHLLKELRALVNAAARVEQLPARLTRAGHARNVFARMGGAKAAGARPGATFRRRARSLEWLWRGRVPRSKVTLLVGDPEAARALRR